jgi:hypothetical protein
MAGMTFPGLLPGEPGYYRGKVLDLSGRYLQVGEAVAFALFEEVLNRLRGGKWPLWDLPPSLGRGERSSAIGDLQVVDGLTQFQVRKTLPGGFFDPRDLLLERRV